MSGFPRQAQNVIKNLLIRDMCRCVEEQNQMLFLRWMHQCWDTPVLERLLNSSIQVCWLNTMHFEVLDEPLASDNPKSEGSLDIPVLNTMSVLTVWLHNDKSSRTDMN